MNKERRARRIAAQEHLQVAAVEICKTLVDISSDNDISDDIRQNLGRIVRELRLHSEEIKELIDAG
jgi:hypothetical protein